MRKTRAKNILRRVSHPTNLKTELQTVPRKRGRPAKKKPLQSEPICYTSSSHSAVEIHPLPRINHVNMKPIQSLTASTIVPINSTITSTFNTTPPRRKLEVSLVVGKSGIARVVQNESLSTECSLENDIISIETNNQSNMMDTSNIQLMSPISSIPKFNDPKLSINRYHEQSWRSSGNDCLAFVTSRQGYVRVEPLHGRWSPLLSTPEMDFVNFNKNTRWEGPGLLSPGSLWDSSEEDATDDEDIMDARIAMKRLIERRRAVGLGLDECLGGEVCNTPSFRAGKRQRRLCCKACHMTFRQFWVLYAHEKKCNVKQTPFLSSDYFDDTMEDCIPYFHEDIRSENNMSSPILPEQISLSKHFENQTPRKNVIAP
ncbi:hypothetical protein PCANB_002412 [Pneumocystis canis]|nr:hypothetical protein PCK1_002554 [Pneumocystis canis]KAG5438692.1 hypothetical protein PCANB_002412 [Pneumocystis canis]